MHRDRGGRAQCRHAERALGGAGRRRVFHQCRHRGGAGPQRRRRILPRAAGEPQGLPHRRRARDAGAGQPLYFARRQLRRRAHPQRHRRAARRARRAMHLEQQVPGRWPSARGYAHAYRSLAAARQQPGILQRRARRLRARRVQRQGDRASGCAEDRCPPAQPESAAVGQRRGGQQARARNLRRRCQVRARHGRGGGAQSPHLRLRERDRRALAVAGAARRGAAGADCAPAGRSTDQGVSMSSPKPRMTVPATAAFDAARLRADFPILHQEVHGRPLVYLDNAATTQKPRQVIDVIDHYYAADNANIHRGVHTLSQRATDAYEGAREKVRAFINAADTREIVFVRGATEAINLVAQSYGRPRFKPGDENLITEMEHHTNIVPWQLLCEQTGAVLKVVPSNEAGELMRDEFHKLLSSRTRLVGVVHISNALGTITPVQEIIAAAHAVGAVVLLDGAQAVAHAAVDVQALDCDFYVFSSHKLYGPTGMGVLYGKRELLEAMPPYQGGGDMIRMVTFDMTDYNALPYKFEAGTPHIAGGIGLGAAIDYVTAIGLDNIAAYEDGLLRYATEQALQIPGLRLIGTAARKAAILGFVLARVHPHDIGTFLDHEGVAIRTGHHCAMPVMDHFAVPATARASFALYNTRGDIYRLIAAILRVHEVFG